MKVGSQGMKPGGLFLVFGTMLLVLFSFIDFVRIIMAEFGFFLQVDHGNILLVMILVTLFWISGQIQSLRTGV